MTKFFPIRRIDGYLPLEDYGLIGDGTTAALVGRDGAISWLCVPRFDSPPLFCNILDTSRGGTFTVAPEELVASRQFYASDSGVLVTEMRSPSGIIQLTDALLFHTGADLTKDTPASRGELLRLVHVLQGQVRVRIAIEPRGGERAEPRSEGLCLRCAIHPELGLQLSSSVPLRGLRTTCDLREGERLFLLLRWGKGVHRYHPMSPDALLHTTIEIWRRWLGCFDYDGPHAPLVRRAALDLKLLDHFENGALLLHPHRHCRRRLAALATGTTAMPGSAMRRFLCMRCGA
jgi:GH15 family glucan-1,4-alpha-glucosidase